MRHTLKDATTKELIGSWEGIKCVDSIADVRNDQEARWLTIVCVQGEIDLWLVSNYEELERYYKEQEPWAFPLDCLLVPLSDIADSKRGPVLEQVTDPDWSHG